MKKTINYKYLNILLILGNLYLLYLMKDTWLNILTKVVNVLLPFIFAFLISYILYPVLKFLSKKKIPKAIGVLLIIVIVFGIFGVIVYYMVPILFDQITNTISYFNHLIKNVELKYDISMGFLYNFLNICASKVISTFKSILTNGSIFKIFSLLADYITNFVVVLTVTIYFLCDMKNIRTKVKNYLTIKNRKLYKMVKEMDYEITQYLKGVVIFTIIQFFEYTFIYFIIGHPNYLFLGILCSITSIIPYLGGIVSDFFALLLALSVSNKLFILTLIVTLVCPNIDGYIISPKVYDKTNKLPALVSIFSVFVCGALFGVIGIITAIPIVIIIKIFLKYYKKMD